MKGFSDFPGLDFDIIDTNNDEFDPHSDFAQFLEEARRYANKESPKEERGKKQQEINHEKKQSKKKSWKLSALFSLWKKTEKETKQCPKSNQASWDSHSHSRNPRHPTHVSGPVRVTGVGADGASSKQHRRPASGPLASLFHHRRKEEKCDIPYVSLDKLTKPHYDSKVYGPVYLVS